MMRDEEKKGMFVSFEGVDGCGKSSVMKKVYETLKAEGYEVYSLREPGGVPISEEIRSIIMDNKNVDMDERCEALLFASARAQLVHSKLHPLLENKCIVLCDRYVDSSLVYQGYARGLGIEGVLAINTFAMDGIWPDVTYLIEIKTEDAQKRMHKDSSHEENRLDVEKMNFHKKVEDGYEIIKNKFPERIKTIDGYQAFDDEVKQICEDIKKRWTKKSS